MTEKRLDCRGLACPQPVLRVKELVEACGAAHLTVLVDNPAARENVGRFLERCGYQTEVEEREGGFIITGIGRESDQGPCQIPASGIEVPRKILVLVGTDQLGRGDADLGRKLLASFIATLKEMGRELWCLVFLNAGVKLAIEGSPVLAELQELEREGAQVLVCGTCLNHFQVLEQKRVGETTNMLDIVSHMQLADKVVTLT